MTTSLMKVSKGNLYYLDEKLSINVVMHLIGGVKDFVTTSYNHEMGFKKCKASFLDGLR